MAFLNFRRRHQAEDVTPDGVSSIEDDIHSDLGGAEAVANLRHFEKMHHLDPNLPLEELCEVDRALNSSNTEKTVGIEQVLIEDNSPYPEVSPGPYNWDFPTLRLIRRPLRLRLAMLLFPFWGIFFLFFFGLLN